MERHNSFFNHYLNIEKLSLLINKFYSINLYQCELYFKLLTLTNKCVVFKIQNGGPNFCSNFKN